MQLKPELIYCGAGNLKLDYFALICGLKYGRRLPLMGETFPIYFSDQDWKNPNLEEYRKQISFYKPEIATVLDWEKEEQEHEIFNWIKEISPLVKKLIVIPKCLIIDKIPVSYNNVEIILGYSVPTKYGKTDLSIDLFKDRKIHLLGGSPNKQIGLCNELDVVSIDCNYMSMKANRFCEAWFNKEFPFTNREKYDKVIKKVYKIFPAFKKVSEKVYKFMTEKHTRSWYSMEYILAERVRNANYFSFLVSCLNYMNWLENDI